MDFDLLWAALDGQQHEQQYEQGTIFPTEKQESCSGCQEPLVDLQVYQGHHVCRNCGTVHDIVIDTGLEWRAIHGGRDASGTKGNKSTRGEIRGQMIHQWNQSSSRERMFQGVNKDFDEIVQRCDLPKVIYKTMCDYYNAVYTAMDERNYGVKRCNIRSGLMAACLFYACKLHRMPREIKEIAEMMKMDRKTVTKGCNDFAEVMGDAFLNLPPFKPSDFAERYCTTLGLSFKDIKRVVKVLEWIETSRVLHECTPPTVAAALIFKMNSERVTFEELTKHCRVSKSVVQKILGKLQIYPEYLVLVDEQATINQEKVNVV